MSKLAVITSEAITVNKDGHTIPCIVLIGRDEENKKRSYRVPYYPYLFIKEEDFFKFNNDKEVSIDKYVKESLGTPIRTLNKKILTKLILRDYKYVEDIKRFLRKIGKIREGGFIYTYEADMANINMLNLRFMIDNEIKSGVEILDDGALIPIEASCKLRIWYLDIETYTNKACSFGLNKNNPITVITWYDNYEDYVYTFYVKNSKWSKKVNFKKIYKNHVIKEFNSEALLLDNFRRKVESLDPDLITGWNIDRYDIVKIVDRMKIDHLNPKLLSPLKDVLTHRQPYRIKGRILFDLMKAYKKFTASELRSYSLLNVIKEEKLKLEKVEFIGSAGECYDKYPNIVFKRNVNDVLVLKELDEKYELIEMFNDLRVEFGLLWEEIFINHRIIDTILLRYIHNKIALGTPNPLAKSEGSYLGANIDAVPGKFKYVAEMDFGREYPSVLKEFNLGPETYRTSDYNGGCHKIEYRDEIYKFVKKPTSLLAQLVNYLFRKRDEYEVEYEKAIKNNDKVSTKKWWRRIFNIKTITNSLYGVADYAGFRLYRKECSAATAVISRMSLEESMNIANKNKYQVIYNHTDSIFINLNSNNLDDALVEARSLEEKLNEGLTKFFKRKFKIDKHPSQLKLKRIYDNLIIVTRTQSAGRYLWDEKKGNNIDFDYTGLEVVRSDSSDLEKEVLETLIKMVLSENKHSEIDDYWNKIKKDFWNKKYTPLEIAYPLQIKYNFKYYNRKDKNGKLKTIPSHIRAALLSNKVLNTEFERGDKPRRLPIKSKENFSIKIGRKERVFGEKDIAIAEDLNIPIKYLRAIDYERIFERLSSKVEKILNLIYIQKTLM